MKVAKKSYIDSARKSFRWLQGMLISSVFSIAYVAAPAYVLAAIPAIVFRWPSFRSAALFATPVILSAIFPAVTMPWLIKRMGPVLDYFDYEEIIETKPVDVRDLLRDGKTFIVAAQPHGVLSYCAICAAVNTDEEFLCTIGTGVASAVLKFPILKHVMGIFYLVDASKANLRKHFRKGGIKGSVKLYVGGMAELFLCSDSEEVLYLKNRKGFIKLALQEGVDVVPVYFFGNTTVLSVLKSGVLASLSRKLQMSLTILWGKWYLPIPRNEKMLYVGGGPLNLPQIDEPTQEDIDKYHSKYCDEVTRLFNTYKERLPKYKHKTLKIV